MRIIDIAQVSEGLSRDELRVDGCVVLDIDGSGFGFDYGGW